MNKHTIDAADLERLKKLALDFIEMECNIIEAITEIESIHDPDDEDDYMNEGEQAELNVLYKLLGRDLDEFEQRRIEILRKINIEGVETMDEVFENAGLRMREEIDVSILKDIRMQAIKEIK